MNINLTYNQAQELVNKYITNPVTKYHLMESEAIMRALAKHFGENEEEWGIIGLLHDIDWDLTKDNTSQHTVKAVEILKSAGASDFLIETIVSHGYGSEQCGVSQGKVRSTKIQHALAAAETLTGIIVASAMVQPDKKLKSVSQKSLMKKFKSQSFAAKCDRKIILECETIGLSLEQFLEIGLKALQPVADKIGL